MECPRVPGQGSSIDGKRSDSRPIVTRCLRHHGCPGLPEWAGGDSVGGMALAASHAPPHAGCRFCGRRRVMRHDSISVEEKDRLRSIR